MEAYQSSQVNMFRSVLGTFNAHPTAWQGLPVLGSAEAALALNLENITAAIAAQGAGTEGATTQKRIYRKDLETDLIRLAAAVRLSGSLGGNEQVAREATLTPSGIAVMGANALLGVAVRINGLATTIGADGLADFGISPEFLQEFSARIAAFTLSIDEPRHAEAEQAQATQELARLIAETSTLLETRMDPAVLLLKDSEPAFYSEYTITRRIVDPATHTRALEVTVRDGETKLPLANVVATITPGDIQKKTGPEGSFYVQSLEPGVYNMKLEKVGYVSRMDGVDIPAGERTQVDVELARG